MSCGASSWKRAAGGLDAVACLARGDGRRASVARGAARSKPRASGASWRTRSCEWLDAKVGHAGAAMEGMPAWRRRIEVARASGASRRTRCHRRLRRGDGAGRAAWKGAGVARVAARSKRSRRRVSLTRAGVATHQALQVPRSRTDPDCRMDERQRFEFEARSKSATASELPWRPARQSHPGCRGHQHSTARASSADSQRVARNACSAGLRADLAHAVDTPPRAGAGGSGRNRYSRGRQVAEHTSPRVRGLSTATNANGRPAAAVRLQRRRAISWRARGPLPAPARRQPVRPGPEPAWRR